MRQSYDKLQVGLAKKKQANLLTRIFLLHALVTGIFVVLASRKSQVALKYRVTGYCVMNTLRFRGRNYKMSTTTTEITSRNSWLDKIADTFSPCRVVKKRVKKERRKERKDRGREKHSWSPSTHGTDSCSFIGPLHQRRNKNVVCNVCARVSPVAMIPGISRDRKMCANERAEREGKRRFATHYSSFRSVPLITQWMHRVIARHDIKVIFPSSLVHMLCFAKPIPNTTYRTKFGFSLVFGRKMCTL